MWHLLLWNSSVYEGISRLIKCSHPERSLHAAIHFVTVAVCICIQTYGRTPMVIIMFSIYLVTFAFGISILSHSHSDYTQVESQLNRSGSLSFGSLPRILAMGAECSNYVCVHICTVCALLDTHKMRLLSQNSPLGESV